LAFLIAGGLLGGCAQSEIERLPATPRSVAVPGAGVYRWDSDRGWVRPDRGSWGDHEQVWTDSRRAFEAGAHADALAGFLILEERLRGASRSGGGEAVKYKDLNFFTGECYYFLGDYENALEYYRRVYRHDLPSPELVDQARLRVFEIGMAYLQEKIPCSFLGMFSYSCPEHGIDILVGTRGGLITEMPTLSYADDALIEVARYYFQSGEYPEAVPLYDRVANSEGSRWRDLAEYQAALAVFLQIRGVEYDQQIIQEAERRFNLYLEHHARGAHVDQAREKTREISEMKGAQNLRIAKFYLREGQPRACRIYLRRVLIQHPNSAAAREAREIQKLLDRAGGAW
jgi:tetratricopeptide (TPR) repeat protein